MHTQFCRGFAVGTVFFSICIDLSGVPAAGVCSGLLHTATKARRYRPATCALFNTRRAWTTALRYGLSLEPCLLLLRTPPPPPALTSLPFLLTRPAGAQGVVYEGTWQGATVAVKFSVVDHLNTHVSGWRNRRRLCMCDRLVAVAAQCNAVLLRGLLSQRPACA